MHAWSDGDCIGEYQLERLIGSGGAGLVYLARHIRLGHRVVIKLLRPDRSTSEQRARFLREGQALARLRHRGIVRLLHADTLADGTEYLILEHAVGVSLRDLLIARGAPLSLREVADVLAQVGSALAYAHSLGVVHRDLKPENLVVRADTDGPGGTGGLRVTLIDFGLAWLQTPERPPASSSVTQLDTHPGARPGTLYYRAPELGPLKPEAGVQPASLRSPAVDAYALGVLGWELLSGMHPSDLQRSAAAAVLIAQRPETPRPLVAQICTLLDTNPMARPDLMRLVACALAVTQGAAPRKKPAQRPPGRRLSLQMIALLATSATGLCLLAGRPALRRIRAPVAPEQGDSGAPVLIVTQPVIGVISDADTRAALDLRRPLAGRIDIAPLQQLGTKLDVANWAELADRQALLVRTRIEPALRASPTPQLAYFGLAPVPLAIHLGTKLSLASVTVFQRDHKNESWRWPAAAPTLAVRTTGLPTETRHDPGPVILRVAASAPIEPALTRRSMPDPLTQPLAEIDVTLPAPDPDALRSEQDAIAVAAAVRQALDSVARHRPGTTAVHLFAAVPCGLALRIGMVMSPTTHPPVQTYQYYRDADPNYRPALLIHARPRSAEETERAMPTQTAPLIERRLEHFVDWLKPDAETESAMAAQAHEIRDRIRAQAAADRLTVRETPSAGSFAKNTGLRRHVTGGSSVDGQDVDVPFVLAPMSDEEQRISRLLDRFQGYAARAYPQNPPRKSRTKSSIKIEFVGSRLSFDLVPMIQAPEHGDGYQWLLRGDGTRRITSVARHNAFITRRTNHSNQQPGRVKFNECVRLLKWWREFRMANDRRSIPGMPSLLIEMLAAYAYDHKGVQASYSETLLSWFDFLHGVVTQRRRIGFSDYPPPRGRRHAAPTPWMVIEAVDPENNLTHDWIDQHIDELAGWLQRGREDIQRAIDLDRRNNPQESLHHLVRVFGTPFKHHCGG